MNGILQQFRIKYECDEINTCPSGQVHPGTHCSSQIVLLWREPQDEPHAFAHSLKIVPSGQVISSARIKLTNKLATSSILISYYDFES